MKVTVRTACYLLLAAAVAAAALLAWNGSRPGAGIDPAPSSPLGAPRQASHPVQRTLPEVRTLLEREGSAYHARLFADDAGLVVVTPTSFTTFQSDRAPQEHVIALGPVVARSGDALVFWRSGSLREVSVFGGPERELAAVPRTPRYLLAPERGLTWIYTDRETGTSLRTLSGGDARVVYESGYEVSACTAQAADIYWVALRGDGSWAIERISLDGQPRLTSAAHHGRPPAMLAVGHDGVYFYDGPQRGIRRLAFDLQRESSVLAGVVCSPFAVSDRVVCAQVGGLFEVPFGAPPRFVAPERAGPVTAVAATPSRVAWIAEKAGERMLVQSVTLANP